MLLGCLFRYHSGNGAKNSYTLPLIAPIQNSKEGLKEKSVTAITLWSKDKLRAPSLFEPGTQTPKRFHCGPSDDHAEFRLFMIVPLNAAAAAGASSPQLPVSTLATPQGRYSTNAGGRRLAPSGQRQRPLQFFHGCLAADPKKAHPRISTTSGMPNAMIAHISSVAHGTSAWALMSL